MSRRKDNNSLKSLCEQMNMNYNTFLKFRKAHLEYVNMSNLELIQFWQSTHTKRSSNEHLIKLARQHGIKESAICQYKRSHKGLTDEQLINSFIQSKQRVPFREKCRQAGINTTNAEYYKRKHPELTDEQIIEWYINRNGRVGRWDTGDESLHSLCKRFNVNYTSAISYKNNHKDLNNVQIIQHFRQDCYINILGELVDTDE